MPALGWSSPGPIASRAFTALKKLEAATEAGITYVEYRKQLGETWFDVKSYLESSESSKAANIKQPLAEAMSAYDGAAKIWRVKIDSRKEYLQITNCEDEERKQCELGSELVAAVPDLTQYESDKRGKPYKFVALDSALQTKWRTASQRLRDAAPAFQR
jgi:hypothetical protein